MRLTSGEVATIDAVIAATVSASSSVGTTALITPERPRWAALTDRAVNSISLTRCMSATLRMFRMPLMLYGTPRRDGVSAKLDSTEETTRSQEKTTSQAPPQTCLLYT